MRQPSCGAVRRAWATPRPSGRQVTRIVTAVSYDHPVLLLKLRVQNFRRFASSQTLDVTERIVALVGSNEAGKTSLLHALQLLLSGEFPGPSDVSRGKRGPSTVQGLFRLDPDDVAAISHVHDGRKVKFARITRRSDNDSTFVDLIPTPTRDVEPRLAALGALCAIEGDALLDAKFSPLDGPVWTPHLFVNVLSVLESEDETLHADHLEEMHQLADQLVALDVDNYESEPAAGYDPPTKAEMRKIGKGSEARAAAIDALRKAEVTEREPRPWRQISDIVLERLPPVAVFDASDRQLARAYALGAAAAETPPGLKNLCDVAGLDLAELHAEVTTGRRGRAEKLIERANDKLKSDFTGSWTQSAIYPRLAYDGDLRVFISTEGDADYSEIDERSSGLRWFLALHAFLTAHQTTAPVLLVDEAETHLHYDAQADLVDVLMAQRLARQVIYSTHSIGCLPPDLGRGVRAVIPVPGVEESTVANSYWSVSPASERIGYTPLLFALGANLLALTVPKYAVIAEGPSDALLLPTLLRVANGLNELPYRILSGLAEVSHTRFDVFRRHGAEVAFIVDGDSDGDDYASRLRAAGFDSSAIMSLKAVGDGTTLEDLVTADAFARAVNEELELWGYEGRVGGSDTPDRGRWNALQAWGTASGEDISGLNKNRVAQRLVDLDRLADPIGDTRTPLLRPDVVTHLIDMHARLLDTLQVPEVLADPS